MPCSSTPVPMRVSTSEKKRGGLTLFQLFIVVGFLVVVGLIFGLNVLAPQKQLSVPERLGTLELVGSIEGSEAMAQINRLHGINIELVSAYIVEYARDNERVTVWVGRTESSNTGAELTRRMVDAIEKGGSGFSNFQRLTIAGHEVFRVDGPGGEHFFYNSKEPRERIVWLIAEATDFLPILGQVLKNF